MTARFPHIRQLQGPSANLSALTYGPPSCLLRRACPLGLLGTSNRPDRTVAPEGPRSMLHWYMGPLRKDPRPCTIGIPNMLGAVSDCAGKARWADHESGVCQKGSSRIRLTLFSLYISVSVSGTLARSYFPCRLCKFRKQQYS